MPSSAPNVSEPSLFVSGHAPPARSRALDALRGFALLGIIMVNAPFFAHPLGQIPAPVTGADVAAAWGVQTFGFGKFFLLFSFLFGFGFATLVERSGGDEGGLRGRFLRRLVGLAVIGVLHATLLFEGDILVLYALLGIVLWFARHGRPALLAACAAVVAIIAMIVQVVAIGAVADDAAAITAPGFRGGFVEVVAQRLALLPISLPFILAFNGPAALAMFLLGLAAGRTRRFPPDRTLLRRGWPVAGAAFLAAAAVSGWAVSVLMDPTFSGEAQAGAAVAWVAVAPVLSAATGFLVLAAATRFEGSTVVGAFALVGGATLTGYVLHSAVLGAVFYGWGLGLHGSLGAAAILAVGAATWVVVLITLALWKSRFRYGPEEWLLRSFVDLEWKRIRR